MENQTRRLSVIANHLSSFNDTQPHAQIVHASSVKSDDDVVVVWAGRTPIGKAGRGSFKDTHWTDLLAHIMKAAVDQSGVPAADIEDIHVGTVLAAGGGAVEAKMAAFAAGLPDNTSLCTTNRQCSSGLQAFANIASAIRSGYIKVGMACGVESMSGHSFNAGVGKLNNKLFSSQGAADCLTPMGVTSENVASKFGISRETQDLFAVRSQNLASKAQSEGLFKDEIVPITVQIKTTEGKTDTVVVDKDDGIRPGSTVESLSKVKAAFKKDGSTTAANSSQVSDGAAAVIAMSRGEAKRRGLSILGKFHSFSVVGVPPSVMGIGPAYAIPPAVEQAGLTLNDIDVFEINEAFASQATYCVQKLGIPLEKVNPLGGAIALGHPLGCTGARMISTLLYQLRRTNQRYGVISMCIGTGMGAAAVFEAEL